MLTLSEIPAELEQLYADFTEKCQLFKKKLPAKDQFKFLSGSLLFSDQNSEGIFYIEDGYCKVYQGDKIVRLHNSGEFITGGKGFASFKAVCDFAVKGCFWTKQEFAALISQTDLISEWLEILELDSAVNLYLAGTYLGDDVSLDFKHKTYKKGDLIIQSGDEPEMIFEMVSGEAVVMSDNKELGKIYEEEIFGEISFLTESTRTADVIASEDCTVRMLDMATFEKLITIKPRMILSISKTLAQRIVHLNDKLVSI